MRQTHGDYGSALNNIVFQGDGEGAIKVSHNPELRALTSITISFQTI